MTCKESITVSRQAVDWLKENYPQLCIKAGLCERVAGRLYTKTLSYPPSQRKPLTDEQIAALLENCIGSLPVAKQLIRAVEAAHGIKEGT